MPFVERDRIDSPAGEPAIRRRFWRRAAADANVQAALVLTVLLYVFFATPLRNYGTHSYCFADFLQQFSLTAVGQPRIPSNTLMGDPAVDYLPWLLFNRDTLSRWKVPLWNPYNGGGVPHLGNYISAVFSPFSLPFYVLGTKPALLVSAWMKLFAIGFFTFLFLKQHRLRIGPALVGAVAFMFSGFNIVWLSVSHAATVVTLPASLYFAERVLKDGSERPGEPQAASRWRRTLSLAGLSLALFGGLLSGQPEVFYFSFLFLSLYVACRLFGIWWEGGRSRASLRRVVPVAVEFAVAGVLAAGMAAIQLLPFFEYLSQSEVVAVRVEHPPGGASMPRAVTPLLFFPNLLGNSTLPVDVVDQLGFTNFAEAMTPYAGPTILFLALCSVFFARQRRSILFPGVVASLWVVYAFDVFGLKPLFRVIPAVAILPVTRSTVVWLFSLSWCAALCLHHLTEKSRSRRTPSVETGMVIVGTALLVLALAGKARLLQQYRGAVVPQAAEFLKFSPWHVAAVVASFVAAVAAVVGTARTQRPLLRLGMTALILWIVFWQTGFTLREFNPTVDDRFVYPLTPAIRRIRASAGRAPVVVVGPDNLVADSNLRYEITMPSNYDGIWIREYDRLYRKHFGGVSWPRNATMFTETGLKLFGVEYLVLPKNWNFSEEAGLELRSLGLLTAARPLLFWQYVDTATRYYSIDSAVVVRSKESAFQRVSAPDFDPYRGAVLVSEKAREPTATMSGRPPAPAAVLREEPDFVRLEVARDRPGYVVLAKPLFPGWKARVNGRPSEVLRANYAFCAVAVGNGKQVVDFFYDPASWKWGLGLSSGSLALGSAVLIRRRREKSRLAEHLSEVPSTTN